MALSKVTINHGNIRAHFQTRGARGGRGDPHRVAARMVVQARINAGTRFDIRTGALLDSVVPIVRETRDGRIEVGVGTTVEHGKLLEVGSPFHTITPARGRWLRHNPSDPRRPRREEWILKGLHEAVPHPGNSARHWMRDAVQAIAPGSLVRVRVLK